VSSGGGSNRVAILLVAAWAAASIILAVYVSEPMRALKVDTRLLYTVDDIHRVRIAGCCLDAPSLIFWHHNRPFYSIAAGLFSKAAGLISGMDANLSIRLMNAGLSALTLLFVLLLARGASPPAPGLAVLFTATSPIFLILSVSGFSEVMLCLLLASSAFFLVSGKLRLSAVLISLAPLVRLEAVIYLPLWAIHLLWKRRRADVVLLGVPFALYALAAWAFLGSPWKINSLYSMMKYKEVFTGYVSTPENLQIEILAAIGTYGWVFAAISAASLIIGLGNALGRLSAAIVAVTALFYFLLVVFDPSFHLRARYFVSILPFLAICSASLLTLASLKLGRAGRAFLLTAAALVVIFNVRTLSVGVAPHFSNNAFETYGQRMKAGGCADWLFNYIDTKAPDSVFWTFRAYDLLLEDKGCRLLKGSRMWTFFPKKEFDGFPPYVDLLDFEIHDGGGIPAGSFILVDAFPAFEDRYRWAGAYGLKLVRSFSNGVVIYEGAPSQGPH
jgi:hypothetical protein